MVGVIQLIFETGLRFKDCVDIYDIETVELHKARGTGPGLEPGTSWIVTMNCFT